MTTLDPKSLTRKEFQEFLPSQRAVRAFEQLFKVVPGELNTLEDRIEQNETDIADLSFSTTSITSSTTLDNDNQVVLCNNATDITITLPVATREGQNIIIKKLGDGSVTISGGTIDGESSLIITHKYDAPYLTFTGSEWYIV